MMNWSTIQLTLHKIHYIKTEIRNHNKYNSSFVFKYNRKRFGSVFKTAFTENNKNVEWNKNLIFWLKKTPAVLCCGSRGKNRENHIFVDVGQFSKTAFIILITENKRK